MSLSSSERRILDVGFKEKVPEEEMAAESPTLSPVAFFPRIGGDDDELNVNGSLTSLSWSDIGNVLGTSLAAGSVLVAFFLYKMRKRSSFHLVYAPRYRWERETARLSHLSGGRYRPLERPPRSAPCWAWARLACTIKDEELLKHVGLEMYVLIRFMRMCLKISFFGSCVVLPIGMSAFATADDSKSSFAWFRFTMANVQKDDAGRIWTAVVLAYVVTLYTLCVIGIECLVFVERSSGSSPAWVRETTPAI